jgi:antigen flippase
VTSIRERTRWLIRGRSTAAAVMQTATLQIATLVLNLATGVLTARLLAPAGRGELLAINLIPNVMAYLLTLGIPAALLYQLKRDPADARKLLGASLVTVSVLSACAVCIGYAILPFALHRYPASTVELARFFMLTTPFAYFVYIGASVFDSVGNFWYSNILRFVSPLLTLVFLCALWAGGRLNVLTAAASYAAPGVVIGIKVLYDTVRRHRPLFYPLVRTPYGRLFSYGLRSFGLDILRTIGDQIDQLLVVAFLSPAAMGLYAVALVISRVLQTFQMATVRVLLPTIAARPVDEVIDAVGRATRVTAALTTPLCLGLIAFGPFILHLVYGAKYAAASGPLRILAVESVFAGTTWILAQAFLAVGKPGVVTALQALGLSVSFPLMLVLIPRFGLIGAGLALAISTFVRFSLALLCFPWLLKKAPPNLLLTRDDVAGLWRRFRPKHGSATFGAQ